MPLTAWLKLGSFYSCLAFAISVSRQVQLGSEDYFLPSTAAWKLDAWREGASEKEEFTPLTVVRLDDAAGPADVVAVLDRYAVVDDVWTPAFAEVLYIQSSGGDVQFHQTLTQILQDYNVSSIFHSEASAANDIIAPGPYFVHSYTGNVYEAYKLYVDTNQAFLQSSYQDALGNHHTLNAAKRSAGGLTVAVPSRLYFTRTADKPLAGLRIAVKDLFDLRGMKTSGGNRALFEISKVKTTTAVAVQRLIDAGAVIVGKNKLSEFAFAGPYVPEHIEYLLPFNPRGDGYNTPGDSSGGSAASVASYDWLDASMGSDTGGSIRGPASVNGIYGNRPTQDAVDLTGALPLSPSMDTAGMLARDPGIWSAINRVLYSDSIRSYRWYPSYILLNPYAQQALDDTGYQYPEVTSRATAFIDALANLTSATVTTFSIDQVWSDNIPQAFGSASAAEVVGSLYKKLTRYEQWNEFGRDFIKSYMDSHDGAFPHLTPGTRQGWLEANATQTPVSYRNDLRSKRIFSRWVSENFLARDDDACSSALYLYFHVPQEGFRYKPDVSTDAANPYIRGLRDQTMLATHTVRGLNPSPEAFTEAGDTLSERSARGNAPPASPGRVASVAGLPDYALTLGSFDLGATTFSNSTLQRQSLPLSVNIVVARGCDGLILDVVEELFKRGVIRRARTGMVV